MENMENTASLNKVDNASKEEKDSISIGEIFKILWKKWWIIAISAIGCAIIAFVFSYVFTAQTYKATSKMYVNNQSTTIGATQTSISSGDITANRSLADSYAIILLSRTTLEKVLDEVELTNDEGVKVKGKYIYSYSQLYNMISVGAIDDTEILGVTVQCTNKEHALALANKILEVFPDQVEKIILGSSTTVVDYAAVATPVSRKLSTKTIIGFLIGAIVACGVILVIYIFIDDTIESSDWVSQTFGESIPLLAIIPNSAQPNNKKGYYGYYRQDNVNEESDK